MTVFNPGRADIKRSVTIWADRFDAEYQEYADLTARIEKLEAGFSELRGES